MSKAHLILPLVLLLLGPIIAIETPLISFSLPDFNTPHTVNKLVGTESKYYVGYYSYTESVILDYDPLDATKSPRLSIIDSGTISSTAIVSSTHLLATRGSS